MSYKFKPTTIEQKISGINIVQTGVGAVGKSSLVLPLGQYSDLARGMMVDKMVFTTGSATFHFLHATDGTDTIGLYQLLKDGTITRNALKKNVNLDVKLDANRHYTINMPSTTVENVTFLDFGGQDIFSAMRSALSKRGIDAVISVYDVTRQDTIDGAIATLDEIMTNIPQTKLPLPVLIVGNKIDLIEKAKIIGISNYAREQIEEVFKTDINVLYNITTSAREDTNIEQYVLGIGKLCINAKK